MAAQLLGSAKSIYNIVLEKRAFRLANTLDPFARGLHADVSLFICTFSRQSHFDVVCDLLLNRRTATWNLSVFVIRAAL